MIITQTPFRISFIGGGTDFPGFYREHGGAVISTSIDKYAYVLTHASNPCFNYKFKASYAQIETVQTPDEFQHPIIRETLRFLNITDGLEINHVSDFPGRTGLGTSSAFTVGLLSALHCLAGKHTEPRSLAEEAVHVEREMVGDPGGHQDQYAVAVGGFNRIDFSRKGVTIKKLPINKDRLKNLGHHLILFFLGLERFSGDILEEQQNRHNDNKPGLCRLLSLVDSAESTLCSTDDIKCFGRIMDEAWSLKKTFASAISNNGIDEIYTQALSAGAWGGKLLGAGGAGFMLLVADPANHPAIEKRLSKLIKVPFKFEKSGSRIILPANSDNDIKGSCST